MLVHPASGSSGGDKRTLVDSLVAHCGTSRLSTINGPVARGIVHRLDRGTSGLIVAAKSDLAHALLGACSLKPADMTALPKVDTICTAPSLIPTVTGNTVRSFSTHGQQSAAKGSSNTASRTLTSD
jgi:hypothetical protein